MEFIALDQEGRFLTPFPNPSSQGGRDNLYKVRSVDIRISFRSEKEFFRFDARARASNLKNSFSDLNEILMSTDLTLYKLSLPP